MKAVFQILMVTLLIQVLAACTSGVPDGFPENLDISTYRRPTPDQIPFRLKERVAPQDVPRMIELGRKLFFDPRLSRSGLMSCATCHNPAFNWTDSLQFSVEGNSRRTMSLFNLAWDNRFMWAGNVQSLVAQAVFPLTAQRGMNTDDAIIVERIAPVPFYHQELMALSQPLVGKPEIDGMISVLLPLEYFISTIMSPQAPFDDWIAGNDRALTDQQKRGFRLFAGKARCAECHTGWRFSDGNVYDIGILARKPSGSAPVTLLPMTKAVGLRNIADRPPYFHDGSMATLEQVIDFYDRGGDEVRPGKSDKTGALHLSPEEKRDLRSFLDSLSGRMEEVAIPILPR